MFWGEGMGFLSLAGSSTTKVLSCIPEIQSTKLSWAEKYGPRGWDEATNYKMLMMLVVAENCCQSIMQGSWFAGLQHSLLN